MTYEASIEMSEESGLEQIDEDEWTDRNFGNSTANDVNTSDDSISDLESDDDDERGIKVVNLMILYGRLKIDISTFCQLCHFVNLACK